MYGINIAKCTLQLSKISMIKTFYTLFINVILFNCLGFGQLLTDGFNSYTNGNLDTQGGWVPYGPGAQVQVESSTPLNYPGYVGTDLGKYLTVPQASVAWAYKSITAQNLTSDFNIWISFLIKININAVNGSYILSFRDYDNKTDGAMLYVTQGSSSSYVTYGVCKLSQIAYTGDYPISSVQLIVMKYAFHTASRDTMFIWVNPSLGSSEPNVSTANAFDAANNDPNWKTSVSNIDIRPMNSNVGFSIDGIRIANTWSQAPLPVVLESFKSTVNENNVTLKWITAGEINNKGFQIIRNGMTVGWIEGSGNSNTPKQYSFTDKDLPDGSYDYALKQIDYNGNNSVIGKQLNLSVTPPKTFEASVYPNPFNSSANLKLHIPSAGQLSIKIFDISGKEIAEIYNGFSSAGRFSYSVSGISLSSGIYFCSIITTAGRKIKKFVVKK